jgi:hypothetical protein
MDKHKQTPDILAEILGGEAEASLEPAPVRRPPSTAKAKPDARPKQSVPTPRKAATPAQWETKVVAFQAYNGWRPRYIDGKELKDWMAGPLLHEYIAWLGEQGWELAAASSGERMYGLADKLQLYFKRAK